MKDDLHVYPCRFKQDIYAAIRAAAKDAGTSIGRIIDRACRIALNVEEQDKADLFIRQRLARAA